MKYPIVDLHKKKSEVLVVHCSDPRFQSAHRHLIDTHGKYYDLLAFPGASKAIAENQLVIDNIVLLHKLHNFETIHIFDHIHCGAFGEIDNEAKAHKEMLIRAKRTLSTALPKVKVVGHLVGEKESIKL